MVNTPDANKLLGGSLHYHPDAYWCPDCWRFVLDCSHLVDPLTTRRVPLSDYLYKAAWFDRKRCVLQVEMNTGELYQYFRVPLSLALRFVRSPEPSVFMKEEIAGKYRFERARSWRQYRKMLLEMAEVVEDLIGWRARAN